MFRNKKKKNTPDIIYFIWENINRRLDPFRKLKTKNGQSSEKEQSDCLSGGSESSEENKSTLWTETQKWKGISTVDIGNTGKNTKQRNRFPAYGDWVPCNKCRYRFWIWLDNSCVVTLSSLIYTFISICHIFRIIRTRNINKKHNFTFKLYFYLKSFDLFLNIGRRYLILEAFVLFEIKKSPMM